MFVQFISLAIVSSLVVATDSELISVVQVFRHGQRTPVQFYTNDPYNNESYWPVTTGQLTATGKQQHYALGSFTRERYGEWLGQYSPSTFRAQTTDIDRTHMSAQCDVAGLFPPADEQIWNANISWQPIPIHPTDSEVMSWSSCAAYNTELSNILANDTYYNGIDALYKSVYEYLSTYSGNNITSVTDVWMLNDALWIENEFGFDLPAWTDLVYPEPLGTLAGYVFQSFAYNQKLARLSAGVFIDTIIDHFDNMLNTSVSTPKYQMFSAHDTNIAVILSALGAFKPHSPYFASSIYFELRESGGENYINIYHKNKEVVEEITLEGCSSFNCPLDEFKSLLNATRIDSDTWSDECGTSETSTSETSTSDTSRSENSGFGSFIWRLLFHQHPKGPGHKM